MIEYPEMTGMVPQPGGPYSPVVAVAGWLVLSGQLGIDPATGLVVDGGVGQQTTQAMKNVQFALAAAGAELGSVVKTTVFLSRMSDFEEMNIAYGASLGGHRPARSTVGGVELARSASVEIEVWAYVGAK